MDAILATLTILLDSAGVTALVGNNIFGGQLPEHYNPEPPTSAEPTGDGPGITLVVKGGETHSEMPLQDVDVQLTAWAGINNNYGARLVYNAVFNVLHDLTMYDAGAVAGIVQRIIATMPAQDVVDPETGWSTAVGIFRVMVMQNTGS